MNFIGTLTKLYTVTGLIVKHSASEDVLISLYIYSYDEVFLDLGRRGEHM